MPVTPALQVLRRTPARETPPSETHAREAHRPAAHPDPAHPDPAHPSAPHPSAPQRPGARPSDGRPSDASPPDAAGDVVRWAVFSSFLVPVVLVGYGASLAGATGTAFGLAAVTAVCRVLLRQSERGAERLRAEERAPHRGRQQKTGSGTHRGSRHAGTYGPADGSSGGPAD